jgi:hypothetical protein
LINASCKRSNIKKNVLLVGKHRKSLRLNNLNNLLKYKKRGEKDKRKEKKRKDEIVIIGSQNKHLPATI